MGTAFGCGVLPTCAYASSRPATTTSRRIPSNSTELDRLNNKPTWRQDFTGGGHIITLPAGIGAVRLSLAYPMDGDAVWVYPFDWTSIRRV